LNLNQFTYYRQSCPGAKPRCQTIPACSAKCVCTTSKRKMLFLLRNQVPEHYACTNDTVFLIKKINSLKVHYLSLARFSLTSHNFLAKLSSCASGLGLSWCLQSAKYAPPSCSTSGASAQYIVVCAPCGAVLLIGYVNGKSSAVKYQGM
jgi:hypothetical protein